MGSVTAADLICVVINVIYTAVWDSLLPDLSPVHLILIERQ
jgi:hypothetical protein